MRGRRLPFIIAGVAWAGTVVLAAMLDGGPQEAWAILLMGVEVIAFGAAWLLDVRGVRMGSVEVIRGWWERRGLDPAKVLPAWSAIAVGIVALVIGGVMLVGSVRQLV